MKNYLVVFIVACAVAAGCSKENSDVFIPYAGNPANDTSWVATSGTGDISYKLFATLYTATYTAVIDPAANTLLHINANLDLSIPANSFTTINGDSLSPGNIKIDINHLQDKGDFIRFARPTTSFGNVLESGCIIYIRAYREDQELVVGNGKALIFSIKDPSPVSAMKVFYGVENPAPPLPAGTNPFFAWQPATDSSAVISVTTGYTLLAKKTGWVNCQYYIDSTLAKTRIATTLPANFTNANTAVFAVFKQRKMVVQLNGDYASRSFNAPNIPLGNPIMLVSVSLIGSQYYLGFKEMTASQNLITIVSPAPHTKTEIDLFLNGL